MLAAEEANQFTYKAGPTTNNEIETAPTEVLTNRLQDLDISKVIPSSTEKTSVPEKVTKTNSNSRPLTVDEDDLDLDFEIDETLDTTVSLLFVFLNDLVRVSLVSSFCVNIVPHFCLFFPCNLMHAA